jgi:polysaccharide export outer membrane protein
MMAFAKPKILLAIGVAALSIGLSGCMSYQPAPRAFSQATIQPYTLDSGDRLRITVFDAEGMTNTYTVDQAGYISFPLIGQVPARGKTPQQLSGQIAQKLKQGYLRDPDVTIDVDRYRSIYVMGEVAGGFSPRAYQGNTDVTRKINGQVMTGRVRISDPVLAGDTIYVRERLF